MNFILGCMALVQIVFLPGLILLKLFKLRRGVVQTIVFAFGLSLIFNFLWVFLLVIFKINFPTLHYILFAVEVGLAVWMYRGNLQTRSEDLASEITTWAKHLPESIGGFFPKDKKESSLSRVIKILAAAVFFIWAAAGLFWLVKLMINEWGTVFKHWDSVVSWNQWASDLFNGSITIKNRYPPLVPANFSITYSYMGSADIQIFAKSFMPFFTLFAWLIMLDLAFEYKKPGMFIGMVILRYMTKKFLGVYIAEGYVDVALLFFSFLTVYSLMKASRSQDEKIKNDYLILGSIFAAGTALTKQNGLLVFVLYPLLALLIVEDNSTDSLKTRISKLLKPMAIGFLVLAPWYTFNEVQILLGLNESNMAFLAGAERHSGRSYWERAVRAVELMGIYKFLFPLAIAALPVIDKHFRRVAALMIFPYSIIWLFMFSIFVRNLAMVFPFLAMTAGLGIYAFLELGLKLTDRIELPRMKVGFALIPVLLILIAFSLEVTDAKLAELQINDQKNALLYKMNHRLYDLFEEENAAAPIMTKYPLEYLPDLGAYKIPEPFTIYQEFYENFSLHPEVAYFLVWDNYASGEVKDQIDIFEESNAVEFLFEEYNMRFYRVLDRKEILEHSPGD